ncbi:DUF1294 domain-containing protein [uncultured Methanospirillum sp.]|uniref:DUF1294 domain-containing protein n=1 Tax=uncultured Methanospirillum sp. TaxID=262503 RepID=UPI0029C8E812|nr:DUF1294 domain-containing protein [uncultured Methanospirillum sp.]
MSDQLLPYLEAAYALVNGGIFLLYGYDKVQARRDRWRISEKNLLIGSLFGPFGAFLAIQIFRHKTQKMRFSLLVPIIMILHVILITLFLTRGW